MAHKWATILCLGGLTLLWSCDDSTIYREVQNVNKVGWDYQSELTFNYTIKDIHSFYSIYLLIDHTTDYEYQNIYFKASYNAPNEPVKEDVFSVDLADNTGQWYGSCASAKCHYEVLLQPNIKYDKPGVYQFVLIQNTRDSLLTDVSKVGMRLEIEK